MTAANGRVTVTEDHAQIEFERTIRAPIAEVWQALTDPAVVASWLTTGTIDATRGGEVSFDFDEGGIVHGRVLESQPPTRLTYSWVMDGAMDSVVEWTLSEAPEGCHLRLVHRTVPVAMSAGYAPGWHAFLDRLAATAEGSPIPDWDERNQEVASQYQG